MHKLNEALPPHSQGFTNAITTQVSYLTNLLHPQSNIHKAHDDTGLAYAAASSRQTSHTAAPGAPLPITQQTAEMADVVGKMVPVCIPMADDPTRTTPVNIAAASATTRSTRMCRRKIASGTRSIRATARSGSARKWAFPTSPALSFLPYRAAIRRTAIPKVLAIDGVGWRIRRGR